MRSWLLIDCGHITSAILVEIHASDSRIVARGEAPTTRNNDITEGVISAIKALEKNSGLVLMSPGKKILREVNGVERVLVSSSAGEGLQMMVAGLVRIMTAESAERAALGAGANVLDVLAIDDGRLPHERVEQMRQLRPDIFLFTGGVDEGNEEDVIALAEQVAHANLGPMPLVYAGNKAARHKVRTILADTYPFSVVENVRPVLENEVLEPTRERIWELFMEHEISTGPGFAELAQWADAPITPSVGATGRLLIAIAQENRRNILYINIGDATCDIFSVFDDRFTRTVTADIGLGRGVANVAVRAGQARIQRHLAHKTEGLIDNLYNLMLKPRENAMTEEEKQLLAAVTREAIRIAIKEHRVRATGLRGVRLERDISNTFDQFSSGKTLLEPMQLHLAMAASSFFRLVDAKTTAIILLDGLPLEGVTSLAIDMLGISPHLGMLAATDANLAQAIFMRCGLEHLGVVISPVGSTRAGGACLNIDIDIPHGKITKQTCRYGELNFLPIPAQSTITLTPSPTFNVGNGKGKSLSFIMPETKLGLIVDTREKVN